VAQATQFPITRSSFSELVQPILGWPLSLAWRGHGSALFLELGPLARASKRSGLRRSTHPRGAATIMIEWSWRVERARSIEVGSFSSERRIEAGIARIGGSRITAVDVAGRLPELVVELSDGRRIHSFMTAEGQPAWVVFLPDRSWITVERGALVHDTQNVRRRRATGSSA